jgi:dienelactone hydrolase
MKKLFVVVSLMFAAGAAPAALIEQTVTYKDAETVLEGFAVWDDSAQAKRPGVLVVHEWNGLDDFARSEATRLAKLGYVAFAADIYGKGVRPATMEEAGKTAGIYKNDRTLLRNRALASLKALQKLEKVDKNRIAAIGYCFGGTTVLELARAGAPVKGVVSFHGGLSSPKPADAKNIKAKVLVLHGGDDPLVPREEVGAFLDEMKKGKVDWQLIEYGGAVHKFMNPAAGNDPSKGYAYNETVAARAWNSMNLFFNEIFQTVVK